MPLSRSTSLALFALGLVASFGWAGWQLSLFEQSHPEPGCGLPILGIYGVAIAGTGVTSLLSTALNILSFRTTPKPRSALRIFELVILAAPVVLAVVLIGGFPYVG